MNTLSQFLISLAGCVVLLCIALPFIRKKKASRFSSAVMFLAGCCAVASVFGQWLDNATGWLPPMARGIVALCAFLFLGIGFGIDYFADKRVDKPGQWIAFILPFFLALLPGALGTQTASIVNDIGKAGNSTVAEARN